MIPYKEYPFENGHEVDPTLLKAGFMTDEEYRTVHMNMPILTHDVIINYNNGLLLLWRDNVPAKGILWTVGGRLKRGVPLEDSLRQRARGECGLELDNLEMLGLARHMFDTDPFGHGKGTDTPNVMFYADGRGEIAVDKLHIGYELVTPEMYTSQFRDSLHPFIQDFVDLTIGRIKQ